MICGQKRPPRYSATEWVTESMYRLRDKHTKGHVDWRKYLPMLLLKLNSTVHTGTRELISRAEIGSSPHHLTSRAELPSEVTSSANYLS